MAGTIIGIYTTDGAGRPMVAQDQARAVAGRGLEGDRYAAGVGYYSDRPTPGGGRELTLIELEVLEALESEHGIKLSPWESRRNLITRSIQLSDLVGKRFRVGEVLCEGVRICEPCVYLEQLTGKAVNEPLVHRGGLRANILAGGVIRAGDPIESIG